LRDPAVAGLRRDNFQSIFQFSKFQNANIPDFSGIFYL